MNLNLANKLTLTRIFLAPIMVAFLLISPSQTTTHIAALIFLLASFTDWLDGYVARGKDQITNLGKMMDPIADKLLIIAGLVPLVELGRAPAWMVFIIIGREIAVMGLRAGVATQGVIISAMNLAKWKMTAQVITIILLMLNYRIGFLELGLLGRIGLWVVLVLSLASAVEYFRKFWEIIAIEK
ncbi:MAG: CDP-diacylglycerol--glycerol-3-phosphate 3-phosphatidyltransferase [Candidatus Tectomicrobia bacterium]|uniref:CDP-diacylglycerol--glycerol-3-phosphate 3-phosphatidyltransferase n=1 Tax=Tectimicrobiota bacterium TaxID=2528274 RepID=A0A933GMI5_UNCTE|nr:CDP-diacylglycerol--glycerol-3-phosphate 3-phosphatidyltransferase [Candidatus Tectomicrobia bacterium]